jgi:hypothetical protein
VAACPLSGWIKVSYCIYAAIAAMTREREKF